ncbi:MAG: hypothetical protein OXF79_16790 [Chloroflexi bacterium]|nr:hypothetical protein [Chloroflexota bacterium]
MITAELYILYGFLAFMSLMLVTLVGFHIRQAFTMGRIVGELRTLTARVERLEEQMGTVREQLAEVRGLLVGMHERMDLLMRHHHDDAGRVVITPEEVAAD